jgi:YXWGXW repeat-containing protein
MRLFRSARWILMTLLLSLVPASSYAGVFISVGIAPPPLVVYDQPPCPEPGLMWTPGYWGYGPDGYYWVPGAWVPAPYTGALWTPGYWGWSTGFYMWHPGYWGPHVGYYGGVNYGFGYMGIGFVGGAWHGGAFAYNTAVVHVNTVVIHNTYIDRTVVERNTIVNDRHVAFSGGPGGINHAPSADERMAMSEHHLAPTSFQTQHANSAMGDHNAYFRNNGGRPQNTAVSRPLASENHPAPFNNNRAAPEMNRGGNSFGSQPRPMNENTHPAPQNSYRPAQNTYHAAPQNEPRTESRPAPQSRPHESKPPKGR